MSNAFHDELIAPGTPDLPERFFDRFMFNMHPTTATAPSIIMGFGHYPAKDVADGFALVSTESEQRNLRFSTELSATAGNGTGPLSFQVIDANRSWRLTLGPNETGMEYDVTWHARTPYWASDVAVTNTGEIPTKFEHLVQSGRYEGRLVLDGVEHEVDGWYGQRDRSRGIRTMSGGQGLHIWCQAQFPDRAVGVLLVESRDGTRLLLEGAVMHEDGTLDDVIDAQHALEFNALDLTRGTLQVTTKSGVDYTLDLDASARGSMMSGAGYGGQHGRACGRDHVEHDVYPLDGSVTQHTLDSPLTDRLTTFDWNGTHGIGILEFALTRSHSYTYQPTLT